MNYKLTNITPIIDKVVILLLYALLDSGQLYAS